MLTNQETINPIGVRVLSSQMMGCTFKQTEEVLQAINVFRKTASESFHSFNKHLRDDPYDTLIVSKGYNNAISILGSRGSGKTSVILTLQHILRYGKDSWNSTITDLKKTEKQNVFMPILVPQDFVAGQSLLSWVIVQLLEKGKEVEKAILSDGSISMGKHGPFAEWIIPEHEDSFTNPLRDCMDELKKSFELRYKSGSNVTGEIEHIYYYMEEVRRDAILTLNMLRLISMIMDYYRFILQHHFHTNEEIQEPLLFFVIDDLDLAPERSQEVLNLILRYLQHPNVVVLCGWNQELFQSHLTMEVLRHQEALDAGLIKVNGDYVDAFMTRHRKRISLLDSARRLAADNLKKAFPPAYRFEIRGLNTEQRAYFPKESFCDNEDEGNISLISLIEKTLLASRKDGKEDHVPFLRNRQGDYLLVYARIFDNKGRGLINVYHSYEKLRAQLVSWNGEKSLDLTSALQNLLDSILFSNTHFVPYRRGLRDLVRIDRIVIQPAQSNKENYCDFYCNYQKVIPVLNEYRKRENAAENEVLSDARYDVESDYNYFPYIAIDVFLLLNFMENVFRFICRLPIYEHGGNVFSETLNELIEPILLPAGENKDILSMTILSTGITSIRLFPDTGDFRVNLQLLDAYERNRFQDGQYDFTGSYSYCRLSEAISGVLGTGEKMKITDSKHQIPVIDAEIFSEYNHAFPEWMGTIKQLFTSMAFTSQNTARLSRFRCYAIQSIFQDEEELVRESNTCGKKGIEDIKKDIQQVPYEKRNYSENDLSELIKAIRETDRLRIAFIGLKKQWVTTPKDSTRFSKLIGDYLRAEEFYQINSSFTDESRKWTEPQYVNKILGKVSQIRYTGDTVPKPDFNVINSSISKATDLLNNLVWNLKIRLEIQFYKEYVKCSTETDQYEYLLKASEKIYKYYSQWNLGDDSWSEQEDIAVFELRGIFEEEGLRWLLKQVQVIEQYGPSLASFGREKYAKAVSNLTEWLKRNSTLFSADRRMQINKNLRTLQYALIHIRRDLEAEEEIAKVVKELGRIIAETSAQLSFSDSVTADKTSYERNRISWPVIRTNRHYFDNWLDLDVSEDVSQIKQMDFVALLNE